MLLYSDIQIYLNLIHGGEQAIATVNPYYSAGILDEQRIEQTFCDSMPEWFTNHRDKEPDKVKVKRAEMFEDIGNPLRGLDNKVIDGLLLMPTVSNYAVSFDDSAVEVKDYFKTIDFENRIWKDAVFGLTKQAMSAIYVLPNFIDENTRNEPNFYTVKAQGVIDLREGSFACILADECVPIEGKKNETGKVVYFFKDEVYVRAVQTRSAVGITENFDALYDFAAEYRKINDELVVVGPLHGMRTLPVFRLGHVLTEKNQLGQAFYESMIADAIPNCRAALLDFFDERVEKALHTANEEWRAAIHSCNTCNGRGKVGQGAEAKSCGTCHGHGTTATVQIGSGFSVMEVPVERGTLLEGEAPKYKTLDNVAGFIPRNLEPGKEFQESFQRNYEKAFWWLGMEYLFRNNANNSGEGKRIDREDSEKKFLGYSKTIVHVIRGVYGCISDAYYYLKSAEEKAVLAPSVRDPTRFNLESARELFEKFLLAKKESSEPMIMRAYLFEFAEKEFGVDSLAYKRIVLASYANPLFGMGVVQQSLAAVTLEWWQRVLSEQVDSIISYFEMAKPGFFELDLLAQVQATENEAKLRAATTKENEFRDLNNNRYVRRSNNSTNLNL